MEQLANDATNVENIDLPQLQSRHRMLGAAYRADRRRMEQLVAQVSQLSASLGTQDQLSKSYAQLKEAHRQQGLQLQRLQDEARKCHKYRNTARQQESIIQKLETLMGTAIKDGRRAKHLEREVERLKAQLREVSGTAAHAQIDLRVKEGEAKAEKQKHEKRLMSRVVGSLRSASEKSHSVVSSPPKKPSPQKVVREVVRDDGASSLELEEARAAHHAAENTKASLQEELAAVKAEAAALREQLAKGGEEELAAQTEERVRMTMRAENSERRAAALQEELTQMARAHAKEVANLKIKLHEKEAQLMGGFGSAANLVLGEMPSGPPPRSAGSDRSGSGRRQLAPIATGGKPGSPPEVDL